MLSGIRGRTLVSQIEANITQCRSFEPWLVNSVLLKKELKITKNVHANTRIFFTCDEPVLCAPKRDALIDTNWGNAEDVTKLLDSIWPQRLP